jgi:hypothetical protein
MLYPKIDKKNDQKWEKKKGLSAFETAPFIEKAGEDGLPGYSERRLYHNNPKGNG